MAVAGTRLPVTVRRNNASAREITSWSVNLMPFATRALAEHHDNRISKNTILFAVADNLCELVMPDDMNLLIAFFVARLFLGPNMLQSIVLARTVFLEIDFLGPMGGAVIVHFMWLWLWLWFIV